MPNVCCTVCGFCYDNEDPDQVETHDEVCSQYKKDVLEKEEGNT